MTSPRPLTGSTLILGVDPGTNHTGYGLILAKGHELELVAQGRLSPNPAWPLARRLAHIYQGLTTILQGHSPKVVAVEDIFCAKNARSALKLGHARGVALLAAAQAGAEVFEYAPKMIKNTVAGYGQADKLQVAHMVAQLLNFHQPLAADAADALAAAICHASQSRFPGLPASSSRRGGWRGMTADEVAALNYTSGKS